MDEKALNALFAAVRIGSFNKAAEALGYTQPGLTQMMNRLEEELDCKLLRRGYNGVQLTPEGQQLLPYFDEMVRAAQAMREQVQHIRAGAEVIRIGSYPSIAKSFLPPLLKKFQEHHADVTLELRVGGYDIREWLASGEVELAFVDESFREDGKWLALLEDPYQAAVSSSCPLCSRTSVSIQDLATHPFIFSNINELKPLTRLSGIREKIHINAADDASLLSLVEQGLGVTLLPALALKGHPDGIHVLSLDPPMKRIIGIVCSQNVNKGANRFIAFVKQELRAGAQSH